MKRLILASAAVFVMTTSAHAVEPYAFGIKAGFSHNKLTNILKATNTDDKKMKDVFFNPGFLGSIYGEYAFHDMLGAGLEVGLCFGRVFKFETKDEKKEDTPSKGTAAKKDEKKAAQGKDYISATSSYIKISPYLAIYPFGRENKEDMGIMYVNVGPDLYMPVSLKVSSKKDGTELTEKDAEELLNKGDLKKWGIGAGLALGYEFSFGLTAELKGSYGFTDFFDKELKKEEPKKEEPKKEGTKKEEPKKELSQGTLMKGTEASKKENSKLWSLGFSLGYNFATLLEE